MPTDHVWPVCHTFQNYLMNSTTFWGKKIFGTKHVFWFHPQLSSETLILERTQWDTINLTISSPYRQVQHNFFFKLCCTCWYGLEIVMHACNGIGSPKTINLLTSSYKVPDICPILIWLTNKNISNHWMFTILESSYSFSTQGYWQRDARSCTCINLGLYH
jgi:hypothetical protein